jgi:hypothetical protein
MTIRAGEVQHLGDVLVAHPVALKVQRARLEVGPHRPIQDDDATASKFEETGGAWQFISEKNELEHSSLHPDALLNQFPRSVKAADWNRWLIF